MNEQPQPRLRVLVVDDDVDLARTLAMILERKGFSVEVAHDGSSAIEKVERVAFDVALLDIKLPEMDGAEVCRRIKALRPGIAAVMMTGYSVEALIQDALHAGAHAILYKPLNIEQTIATIEQARRQAGALVLVVDDYPDTCRVLLRVLESKGWRARCVADGESALTCVKEQQYDVIFIDMKLPTMDGLQTYRALREIDSQVAVVLITAYRQEMGDRVDAALHEHAYACLPKPFDMEQVLSLVEEIARVKVAKMPK